MPGAAAAASHGEPTDLSQPVAGKGAEKGPLARLSERANAVKAAMSRSPGASPEQKKIRTEDLMEGLQD
eukprot:5749977-Pyramimonas_sp.AAC.1